MLKRPSPSVVAVVLTILIAYGLLSACTQPIPSASPRGDSGCSRWCSRRYRGAGDTAGNGDGCADQDADGDHRRFPYLAPLQDSAKERSLDIYVPVPSTGDLDEQHPVWSSHTATTRAKTPWRPCAEPWLSGVLWCTHRAGGRIRAQRRLGAR